MISNGTRLRSQVCETQVIVIRAADSLDDLRAGGKPMVDLAGGAAAHGGPDPAFIGPTAVGKRYVSDDGAEVLVTKGGAGALSVGAMLLRVKEAKPLPASD